MSGLALPAACCAITGDFPLTVQFTDTSTSQALITAWAWAFGDGGTSDQQHPSHTYTAAGVYTVTLTVTGSGGSGTKTRANYIAVSVPPPPIPDFGASPTAGPPPLTVHFTDLSEHATAWLWDFGDGGSAAERNPDHVYVATGVYTVTLTASGPGGVASKIVPSLITVGPTEVSFDIPLAAGWNLVSLPVEPTNASVSSIFAPIAGGLTIVYAYQGCDAGDPWKKYDPSALPFSAWFILSDRHINN